MVIRRDFAVFLNSSTPTNNSRLQEAFSRMFHISLLWWFREVAAFRGLPCREMRSISSDYACLRQVVSLGGKVLLIMGLERCIFGGVIWTETSFISCIMVVREILLFYKTSSILTDNSRLKEVISLGGPTFHCYDGLEKQPLLKINYAEKVTHFLKLCSFNKVVSLTGFKFY